MKNTYTIVVPDPSQPKWAMPEHFLNLFAWNKLELLTSTTRDPGKLDAGSSKPIYALNLNNQYRLDKDLALSKSANNNYVYEAFDKQVWAEVEKRNGVLLLDSAVEALDCRGDIAAGLLRGIERESINPNRVVVLNNNLRAHGLFERKYLSALKDRPHIVDFDSCYWLMVGLNQMTNDTRERIEKRAQSASSARSSRSKKFVSFNGRLRPHRFYILLWLFAQGYFDDGLISFLAYNQGGREFNLERLKQGLRHYPEYDETIKYADDFAALLPISLDVSLEESQMSAAYKRTLPWRSQSSEHYDNAYFSIIVDTNFHEQDFLFITPIAFKSFMNFSPFVYFGNSGALRRMRELGFETFSPLIDESYDDVADAKERMKLAFEQVRRLNALSSARLAEFYNELWPVLEHNYWHFHRDAPAQAGAVLERNLLGPITEACS